MDEQERLFLEKCIGKNLRIVQKDGFIKSGLCRGYSEISLFLEFNDGSEVAIALDSILEKKIEEFE
jgi:hypothetical protein